jgi:hypothetical protein
MHAAASHVAGAVSAKVGEIRADWRKQQEEQLASDTARPMEERISHAKRAAEERLEQTKKEHEKSGHVEWLSETKPVEFAREARDKVAEVTGINKARKVIGEKSHEFADEVREAKHTYGIALGRAKDAAVGKVHAAKEYIEDTGEWMKKGIDIAEGKIEHMFGIHIPRRTEGAEPQHYAYDVRVECCFIVIEGHLLKWVRRNGATILLSRQVLGMQRKSKENTMEM